MSNKIFIILIFLTLATFLVGYLEFSGVIVVAILLVSVLIKGQLIIDHFMGLKNVVWGYRLIPTIWLVFVTLAIFSTYYFPL